MFHKAKENKEILKFLKMEWMCSDDTKDVYWDGSAYTSIYIGYF